MADWFLLLTALSNIEMLIVIKITSKHDNYSNSRNGDKPNPPKINNFYKNQNLTNLTN